MRIASNIFAILLLVSFIGCKKDNNTTEPEVVSVITIDAPPASTVIINGTALTVTGNMTDDNVLAIAKLQITNKSSGAVYNAQSTNTGNVGYYAFNWTWTVTGITAPTPAIVKVIARDKLGNEVSKQVEVTLDN